MLVAKGFLHTHLQPLKVGIDQSEMGKDERLEVPDVCLAKLTQAYDEPNGILPLLPGAAISRLWGGG